MSDEKRDTFPDLIRDMREMGKLQASMELDDFARAYADRLEALLAAMDPFLMPVYGQALAGGAIETDPPPILADLLEGHDVPPGSDWVVVDPTLGHFGPPTGATDDEVRDWYDTHDTVTGKPIDRPVTGDR